MEEKFYDSDLASINQKDFLSDNQPPKDLLRQKRLLKKTKFQRSHKSIYRIGSNLDKPARFDLVTLRFKESQQPFCQFALEGEFIEYNLGLSEQFLRIQDLVTSMKMGEIALFQIENLKLCQQTGLKILQSANYFLIELKKWITTIDLDADKVFMKQIHVKGQGGQRVSQTDQVLLEFSITYKNQTIECNINQHKRLDQIDQMPNTVERIIKSMKNQEESVTQISYNNFTHLQKQDIIDKLLVGNLADQAKFIVKIKIKDMRKVEDIYFDKKLLKKIIKKGTSTAKPQRTSLIYYALAFLDKEGNICKCDNNFEIREQDLEKLTVLSIRNNYLDQYKISRMLKNILIRMKPSEISQIVCTDPNLFKYGEDFKQILSLFNQIPKQIKLRVKVFNFHEGKTAFNMQVDQKIFHAKRKKQIGLVLLKQNNIKKALKTFQQINAFFTYGIDTLEDKEKVKQLQVSCLLNTTLCYMKNNNNEKIIMVCKKIKQLKNSEKCVYRLCQAYKLISEYDKALQQIQQFQKQNEKIGTQLVELRRQLLKKKQQYHKKQKERYVNMFR